MTSAKEFFANEAPQMLAAVKQKLGNKAPKVSCDIEIEVEGEGMFSIAIKNGDATVRRGGAANPVLALKLAPVTFADGLSKLVKPRSEHFVKIDLDKAEAVAQAEMKKQLAGRTPVAPEKALQVAQQLPMRIVLELQPRGDHRCEALIGGAEEDDPTVTVMAAQVDVDAIFAGQLNPVEAFKTGKIKMSGQVSTGMALLSRLFV